MKHKEGEEETHIFMKTEKAKKKVYAHIIILATGTMGRKGSKYGITYSFSTHSVEFFRQTLKSIIKTIDRNSSV